MTATILRCYGWLFLAAGALFVAGDAPSLWLGLAGAYMAVIAYLAFALAREPANAAAWGALLLAKAASTALFLAFAAAAGHGLLLAGAAVDGAILSHLLALRRRVPPDPGALLRPRWRGGAAPGYEVWFVKLNDRRSGDAFWCRYTLLRGAGAAEAACWYVLFDAAGRAVHSGHWSAPLAEVELDRGGCLFRLGDSALAPGRATGRHDGVSWDLRWESTGAPPFGFVPAALRALRVASSEYWSPVSFARFRGEVAASGARWRFEEADGSLGHIFGRRMADNWRWAHAVLRDASGAPTVIEVLSAAVRVGGREVRLTTANLWHAGRLYEASSLRAALRNRSELEGDLWRFALHFGNLRAAGACGPAADLTAQLEYLSPDGRRLLCRNSKTGWLQLRLARRDGRSVAELHTKNAAAVERVETVT